MPLLSLGVDEFSRIVKYTDPIAVVSLSQTCRFMRSILQPEPCMWRVLDSAFFVTDGEDVDTMGRTFYAIGAFLWYARATSTPITFVVDQAVAEIFNTAGATAFWQKVLPRLAPVVQKLVVFHAGRSVSVSRRGHFSALNRLEVYGDGFLGHAVPGTLAFASALKKVFAQQGVAPLALPLIMTRTVAHVILGSQTRPLSDLTAVQVLLLVRNCPNLETFYGAFVLVPCTAFPHEFCQVQELSRLSQLGLRIQGADNVGHLDFPIVFAAFLRSVRLPAIVNLDLPSSCCREDCLDSLASAMSHCSTTKRHCVIKFPLGTMFEGQCAHSSSLLAFKFIGVGSSVSVECV